MSAVSVVEHQQEQHLQPAVSFNKARLQQEESKQRKMWADEEDDEHVDQGYMAPSCWLVFGDECTYYAKPFSFVAWIEETFHVASELEKIRIANGLKYAHAFNPLSKCIQPGGMKKRTYITISWTATNYQAISSRFRTPLSVPRALRVRFENVFGKVQFVHGNRILNSKFVSNNIYDQLSIEDDEDEDQVDNDDLEEV